MRKYLLAFALVWLSIAQAAVEDWKTTLECGLDAIRSYRFKEAEAVLRKANHLADKDFTGDLATSHALASLYQDLGRFMEAEALYKHILAILSTKPSDEVELERFRTENNLAALYMENGYVNRANSLKLERWTFSKLSSAELARLNCSLASLAGANGRRKEAVDYYLSALRMWGTSPKYAIEHAIATSNLSLVEYDLGDHAAAIRHIDEAVESLTAVLGEDHPLMIRALANAGWLRMREHQPKEAAELLKRALRLAEKALGSNHMVTAAILETCSDALKQAGLKAEGKEMRKRANSVKASFVQAQAERHIVNVSDFLPRQGR